METHEAVLVRHERAGGGRVMIGLIAGALLVQALLRMWVAIDLLRNAGIEGELGAMVHWRVFDAFAGWVGLMLLAMADEAEPTGAPWKIALRWVLAVGLVTLTVSLLWGEVGGVAILDIVVAGFLAIAGILLVARQMLRMARSGSGLDIEQLWRGVALQWVLLWIAAEVVLRIRFWKEGVESEERARALVFVLPVVGMLPNVMMAMGIRWWGAVRTRLGERVKGNVKVRAWMVGLVAVNLGAACVVAAEWFPWLGILGTGLMIVGIGMYLLGFPRGAWRTAGKMVPPAFGLLVLGLAMMGAERIAQVGSGGGAVIPMLYSAAWRQVLASAVVVWLLGMGGLALATVVDARVRAGTRGAVMASGFMIVLGVLATAGTMLAAIESRDVIQGLFVGAGLGLFGVVVGAAAALRGGRGFRA